MSSAKLMIRR